VEQPQVQTLALRRADPSSSTRHAVWLTALLIWVAACYAPALPGPFQFDDRIGVAVDPAAASLPAWWRGVTAHVRPALKASFALSHTLGDAIGDVPAAHRLVNLTLHLATIGLLFGIGWGLTSTAVPQLSAGCAARAAALAAALFGLHPLCTEAVSYVSGRSMSLGTLLACACLACWARGRNGSSPGWCLASLLIAVLAALCRETVVFSLLLLVPAWELLRRSELGRASAPDRAGAVPRAPALAAAAFAAVAAAILLWMLVGHERYAALLRLSGWITLLRAGDASLLAALTHFAQVTLLLRPPSIDPDVSAAMPPAARLAAMAVACVTLAAAWHVRVARPQWLIAAVWVLAWLLPIYALPLRHDAVSERHLYPALWGPVWALAVTLAAAADRWNRPPARSAVLVMALALLSALSTLTAARNLDYRSEVALWEAASRSDPNKLRVLNNLGFVYMEAGRWDEAASVLQHATSLYPWDQTVRWNLAAARARDLRVLDQPALPPWQ